MIIEAAMASTGSTICWLCCRPLGLRIEWHHPCPKSRGGRERVAIHPICHRTLHAHFSNAELLRIGGDLFTLRNDERIARFLAWVESKPADFHAPTFRKR
jgi:hypothetical protein